jgi:glycolate oxidase
MLIFKLDNGTQEAMDVINKLLNDHNADHIQVTQDATEQAALEKLRQDMLPAIFTGNQHIMEDMAVPLSQLAPLMDYIQDLSKELGVKIYTAGHAGDGNVHPSIVWPESVKETPDTVIIALQKMFKKTLELGGTISGEHAVGMLKNQWNNAELGEDVDQLQHQIKDLFDPMNVLNPKRKID